MISTTAMIKLNKVYNNLMVDVKISNKKLFKRALSIVSDVCSCNLKESELYLNKSQGNVKAAIVMKMKKKTFSDSVSLLSEYNGSLKKVLESHK